MNIFKKIKNTAKESYEMTEVLQEITAPEPTPPSEPEEEWVWVEGYKATDKDMKCRGYQYEFGAQYTMLEGELIQECKSGFHLCLKLHDVFFYYHVGDGNRFFKVQALVRKSDKDHYRSALAYYDGYCGCCDSNKLVAKSIIFTSELTYDEILKDTEVRDLPEEYKQMAINDGIEWAVTQYRINILVKDGYSLPFATYIIQNNKFETAHAFGSQKDLSIDMKVWGILTEGGIL